MEKLEKMRSIILEKQKSKEAFEVSTAIQLEKEREAEFERNRSASATIKSFITEVPEILEETEEERQEELPEEPEILGPQIPPFIIPFRETSFFIKHYSEVPIEVSLTVVNYSPYYFKGFFYLFRNFQVKLMIL